MFQPYKSATRPGAPRYYDAAIQDQRTEQANRAQMFNELVGSVALYDAITGDSTPIADALRSMSGGETADVVANAQPVKNSQFASAVPSDVYTPPAGDSSMFSSAAPVNVYTPPTNTAAAAPANAGASTAGGSSALATAGMYAGIPAAMYAGYRADQYADEGIENRYGKDARRAFDLATLPIDFGVETANPENWSKALRMKGVF